jgi:hypothetical protein
MKYKANLDSEGYIYSLEENGDVEVDLEQTRLHPLFCFKVVDNKAVYDEQHYQDYLQKQKDLQEIEELKTYLNSTDYIWNSIKEGGRTEEYYAEVIAKRKEARKRIQELEEA